MERIGREVGEALGRAGGDQGRSLAEITGVWPDAVGPAVARRAWPARIARDGTLNVSVSSSTWAFELDRLAPEISERLGALLGEHAPAGLRFRVGPVPEPGSPEPAGQNREPLPTTPEDAALASDLTAGIDDPDLREIVARAARASLASARLRPPDLVD